MFTYIHSIILVKYSTHFNILHLIFYSVVLYALRCSIVYDSVDIPQVDPHS